MNTARKAKEHENSPCAHWSTAENCKWATRPGRVMILGFEDFWNWFCCEFVCSVHIQLDSKAVRSFVSAAGGLLGPLGQLGGRPASDHLLSLHNISWARSGSRMDHQGPRIHEDCRDANVALRLASLSSKLLSYSNRIGGSNRPQRVGWCHTCQPTIGLELDRRNKKWTVWRPKAGIHRNATLQNALGDHMVYQILQLLQQLQNVDSSIVAYSKCHHPRAYKH